MAVVEGAVSERIWLDERSWIDVARGWLADAEAVYDEVLAATPWNQGRVFRYERWVDEPRLTAWQPAGRTAPAPVLDDVHRAVVARCGVPFDGYALSWYRDGRDSVAFHRDRELRWLEDTVLAVLTLGARRPFLVRPRSRRYDHEAPARGATHDLAPAGGDLLVMGGRCQTDWEHSVPKVRHAVGGRISLQWRWTSRRGRPEQGANYRAPRHFDR
jgi:alkylated DNA repair dioxygenase AlkB